MAEKDQKDEAPSEKKEAAEAEQVAELKDRLLRLAAEFDNYKKRVAKDLDGSKNIGRAEVISKLLPTVDEFELALNAFGKEDDHFKGMALVFSNFMSTLRSFGLREIKSDGKFDPYRHEIVLARDSDRPEGEILEVVRKGYMVDDMMVRPASVIISKNTVVNDGNGSKKG
jgi:molecular chaperone GrpE